MTVPSSGDEVCTRKGLTNMTVLSHDAPNEGAATGTSGHTAGPPHRPLHVNERKGDRIAEGDPGHPISALRVANLPSGGGAGEMRRYLVVADRTLGGPDLARLMLERLAEGPCDFHIVVPASAPKDPWLDTESESIKGARARLEDAIERLSALGAIVVGDIGDPRPMDAIADALYGRKFDGVIVSTLPEGRSPWLKMNLPDKVRARFSLPVVQVEWDPDLAAESEPAGFDRLAAT
jgi:hypothetical protein